MKTLNIIGPGRLGRTLGALWARAEALTIQDVLARSTAQGALAVQFIGAGQPAADLAAMRPADVWLISTPDAQIARTCRALAEAGLLRAGDVVFHCSGALPAAELAAAAAQGARIASVHPLKSFADPAAAQATFTGTYCVAEGDAEALDILRPAFEAIGARVSEIDPALKTIYHAASVLVCNDLTALLETGLRCYEKSGIERGTAAAMMEPLVRETLDNVFRLGTANALTGPVARGDDAVVARQLEALAAWDARAAAIYRALGAVAVELAREQGQASAEALARLSALLNVETRPKNTDV